VAASNTEQYVVPGTDADLNSASCAGIGLQYPHLWEVVRRYILRGDHYFQHGGLTTLAANIWEMPLAEAVDTIEQYYEKFGYLPPAAGQRGGVNFAGLRAIHAIATTPDTGVAPDAETRKQRMLALLGRHKSVVDARLAPQSYGDTYAGDRAAVDETINAIMNDRQWEISLKQPDPQPEPLTSANTDPVPAPTVAEQVERAVVRAMESLQRQAPASISASDLITFKYGLDQLQQRVEFQDTRSDQRFAEVDRTIDRFLGKRQIEQGGGQLKLAWAAVVIALASVVAWGATTFGFIKPL
jgi:hypothetical protein